jgi:uncharacterized protein (TIGR00255 family)
MIRSMTGFGAGRGASGVEQVDVEIRAVNAKFCEVKVRVPRELLALETEAVRQVKERLARGGIEVSVRRSAARGAMTPRVDQALAAEYAGAFAALREALRLPGEVGIADILSAEGVVTLEERGADLAAAGAALAAALAQALDSLVAMREREGAALARDLTGRLGGLEEMIRRVEVLAPQTVEQVRQRLVERVAELARGYEPDPVRLATEVALLADRLDVSEEITRLRSHFAQLRALVTGGEPAGRKMDFLVQEMNREVNTIGSKSQNAEVATLVVSLKAEIERMREQVQNVE